jgi:hypothetical protein
MLMLDISNLDYTDLKLCFSYCLRPCEEELEEATHVLEEDIDSGAATGERARCMAQYELGELRQKTKEEVAHVRRATKVSVQSELSIEAAWAIYTARQKGSGSSTG